MSSNNINTDISSKENFIITKPTIVCTNASSPTHAPTKPISKTQTIDSDLNDLNGSRYRVLAAVHRSLSLHFYSKNIYQSKILYIFILIK